MQGLCLAENVAVLPYFGLAAGYLTGKYRSQADLGKSPRGSRADHYMQRTGPAVLAAMDAVAAETGASLPAIALAWLVAQPGITAPIASATSQEQLAELLPSLRLSLTADQLARLSEAGAPVKA
jgi:aryl-alcohol dehydrogenase-like predicted oxidoreductase